MLLEHSLKSIPRPDITSIRVHQISLFVHDVSVLVMIDIGALELPLDLAFYGPVPISLKLAHDVIDIELPDRRLFRIGLNPGLHVLLLDPLLLLSCRLCLRVVIQLLVALRELN